MKRLFAGLYLLLLLILAPLAPHNHVHAQDGQVEPKGKTEPSKEDKLKGFLPMYWKNLGLTDTQKQQVYKVQAEYKKKIEAVEQQIEQLKEARKKELEAILTAEQKAELRKIIQGKAPSP